MDDLAFELGLWLRSKFYFTIEQYEKETKEKIPERFEKFRK